MAKLLKELETNENTLIGLQRIRVFYNPTLFENVEIVDDFMKFVLCLLQTFLEQDSGEQTEAILTHLKELVSIEIVGKTVVGYLANQMATLAEILEEASEGETDTTEKMIAVLPKFLATLLKC